MSSMSAHSKYFQPCLPLFDIKIHDLWEAGCQRTSAATYIPRMYDSYLMAPNGRGLTRAYGGQCAQSRVPDSTPTFVIEQARLAQNPPSHPLSLQFRISQLAPLLQRLHLLLGILKPKTLRTTKSSMHSKESSAENEEH